MKLDLDIAQAETYLAEGMSENGVAREMGVSRTTLRRHLQARRDQGLLTTGERAPDAGDHPVLDTAAGLPSDMELAEMIIAGAMPQHLAAAIASPDLRRISLIAKDVAAARASASRAASLAPPPGPQLVRGRRDIRVLPLPDPGVLRAKPGAGRRAIDHR